MRTRSNRGQSLVEFSLVLPLLLVTALGVVEVGYALLDQHIVTKLTREGSNLISRSTTLGDAATAMRTMSTRPVDLNNGSKLILSVVRNVPTIGAANYNKAILAQRYVYGSLAGKNSTIQTAGTPSFGPGPEYQAPNQDSNTALQVTNLPVTLSLGGSLYICELYTTHPTITPLAGFGIQVPDTLYSIAYF
jgi:Flp pilus assembly protein TadG